MGQFKEIQIELFEAIQGRIDAFLDTLGHIPIDMVIICELRRYFTFDELFICMDDIEEYTAKYRGLYESEAARHDARL